MSSPAPLPSQSKWSETLTHSIPRFEDFPKRFLSSEEKEFVLWLHSFRVHDHFQLISSFTLASKVKELWGWLLSGVSVSTLQKHLVRLTASSSSRHNKSYLNRAYRLSTGRSFGLWLFRKGLVRGFSVPKSGVRCVVRYGYPLTRYSLVATNFVSSFPPHDFFASLCSSSLQSSLGSNALRKVDPRKYSVPHSDGSGHYVVDNCYSFQYNGREHYLWQEVHTGSEGYDSSYFLKRLITMEQYLSSTQNGFYVVFLPFVRDLSRAERSLTRLSTLAPSSFPLRRCFIVPYTHIPLFKERLGFYRHQKR